MAQSRFGSQVVPKDTTQKAGYLFFPVSAYSVSGLSANATYAAVTTAGPTGVQLNSTNAATIITDPLFVPNDLDTSSSCYASVVYASVTTATTATATMAVTFQDIGNGSTIVTPATTCAAISNVTMAATIGYTTVSSSALMSAKPTPGNLLTFKVVADPLVADTMSVLGVKMTYTKRFL